MLLPHSELFVHESLRLTIPTCTTTLTDKLEQNVDVY